MDDNCITYKEFQLVAHNFNYLYQSGNTRYYSKDEDFFSFTGDKEVFDASTKYFTKKISFSEMFFNYLVTLDENSYFYKLMESYLFLCEKQIGVSYKYINTLEDLKDIEELFFKQEQELV